MYLLTVLTLPLVLVPLVARGRAWLVCGLSVRPRDRALLERFVNKSHRSTDEVAGDATQVQSTAVQKTNERNRSDRIRQHSDVGVRRCCNRASRQHAHGVRGRDHGCDRFDPLMSVLTRRITPPWLRAIWI